MPHGNELFLTIPCEIDKGVDKPHPIYMGPCGYICPFCFSLYANCPTCLKHMGMFSYNGNTTCVPLMEGKVSFKVGHCLFCFPIKEFSSFKSLAHHVQNKHLKEVDILNHAVRQTGNENMLPQTSGSRGKKPRTGLPFLTFEMLTTTPKDATIVDVKYDESNQFGPSVILKVILDRKTILWTVRIKNNPNYELLTEQFGHDEESFKDKKIQLHMEKDTFSEQFFPRVSFPTPEMTKRAARG
jgi:hypothetical protein